MSAPQLVTNGPSPVPSTVSKAAAWEWLSGLFDLIGTKPSRVCEVTWTPRGISITRFVETDEGRTLGKDSCVATITHKIRYDENELAAMATATQDQIRALNDQMQSLSSRPVTITIDGTVIAQAVYQNTAFSEVMDDLADVLRKRGV